MRNLLAISAGLSKSAAHREGAVVGISEPCSRCGAMACAKGRAVVVRSCSANCRKICPGLCFGKPVRRKESKFHLGRTFVRRAVIVRFRRGGNRSKYPFRWWLVLDARIGLVLGWNYSRVYLEMNAFASLGSESNVGVSGGNERSASILWFKHCRPGISSLGRVGSLRKAIARQGESIKDGPEFPCRSSVSFFRYQSRGGRSAWGLGEVAGCTFETGRGGAKWPLRCGEICPHGAVGNRRHFVRYRGW